MIDFSNENNFPKYQFSKSEYSESDIINAMKILTKLGATYEDESWRLTDSQEISQYKFKLGSNCIVIQADTNMGLIIFAKKEILKQLKRGWKTQSNKFRFTKWLENSNYVK